MMRMIDKSDVAQIAVGAAVLGTGGGGDPTLGRLMAEAAIDAHGPVRLIEVDDVPASAWVIPSSGVGAPTVSIEKLSSWREIDNSFDDAQTALGAQAFATMPIEIGGANALIPLALAARRGLPMVDADAMGRAFPESQMVSFALDGIQSKIVCVADEKGNRITLRPIDAKWQEVLVRSLVDRMGGSAMVCDFPVTGAELRASGLAGTVTLAQRIGRALMDSHVHHGDRLGALLAATRGHLLMKGKIVDLDRRTVGGFARGSLTLEGTDADRGRRLQIFFQNEFLYAQEGGQPRAMTPDLIAVLDRDSALPWTTEGLRYGLRVHVVAMPCVSKWRTPHGLATVGPTYFGYDSPYVPIEELAARQI
jgi:DUF917 family protein